MIKWLLAHPCTSHAVVSTLEALVLIAIVHFTGIDAWLAQHPPAIALVIGCGYVSSMYYGREAGQREHDLKHFVPPVSGFWAFVGAEYALRWQWANWQQWLSAAGATAVLGVVLYCVATLV